MEIQHVVKDIKNGQISIPYFQRGYTWDRVRAVDLMDSLYRQYPIGIVTYWDQETKDRTTKMIVDGQQRLSTIYACCTGEVPPTYTNTDKVPLTEMYFDPEKEKFQFIRGRGTKNPILIKTSEVLGDKYKDALSAWACRAETAGILPEQRREYEQRINKLLRIRDRDIKEQEINTEITADDVIQIFNRINTKGKGLTTGELEMAWISNIWREAREEIKREIARWRNHPIRQVTTADNIIRTMGTIHTGRYEKDGFRKSSPSKEDLRNALLKVRDAHDAIAELLTERLRISESKSVSTAAPFTVIAKYLQKNGGKFISASEEAKAAAYFLTASSWRIYRGATPTQIDNDLKAMDTEDPWEAVHKNARATIGEVTADPVMFDVKRNGSDRFYSMLDFIRKTPEVTDWYTNIPIRKYQPEELEQHHIFPKAQLEKTATKDEDVDNVGNIALITGETNREITDTATSEYLAEIDNKDYKILEAHCITRNRSLWNIEKYEEFLQERRNLMAQKANKNIEMLRKGIFP